MKIRLIRGQLLKFAPAPHFAAGELLIEDGRIVAVGAPGEYDTADADVLDMQGAMVAPGLVDVHTHGRAGGDFISADRPTLERMARSYLSVGTTTVMPTLASAPLTGFVAAAERIADASVGGAGARLMGLHVEGRYLNPAKRGAHAPELLSSLDADELTALHGRLSAAFAGKTLPFPCRLSAAWELDKDGSFMAAAKELGIQCSLGHTQATYAQARQAIDRGVRGFTHLYNTMPPLHHRDGGAVAACLEAAAQGRDVYGELICDGLHVSPEMIRLAYALLGHDHTVLITDSMEGAGCPDGRYAIAGQPVILKDGRAVTEDGALAGSTLGLWQAVCNLAAFCRIPLADALTCATRNPARLAGIDRLVGSLEVGRYADIIVIEQQDVDRPPRLCDVYLGGVRQKGLV